jgi:hypothetical protein
MNKTFDYQLLAGQIVIVSLAVLALTAPLALVFLLVYKGL